MELPHIGENCALKQCNQLDFLPVKCDACSQVFCLEHYRYERHSCDKAQSRDVQVPVCPLCMKPVVGKRGQLPDIAVSEHIDRYCDQNELLKSRLKANGAKVKPATNLQACSHRSCKQKDLIYLECNDCKSKFCIKHRHPNDHSCPGPTLPSFGSNLAQNWSSLKESCSTNASSSFSMIKNKASQMSKSGQAAINRLKAASTSAAGPSSHSRSGTVSAANGDIRGGGGAAAASNLQGNLSEQEAMAIALRESAMAAAGRTTTTSPTILLNEDEDAALARAIHESEMEARRNQGTSSSRPSGSQAKDSCVLS